MKNKIPDIPSRRARFVKAGILILLAFLLLAGALSIPFLFESPSIRYKFGFDKTLLRTGKLMGVVAATLLFFQLLLSARLKFLDRIFSLPRIYTIHRVNAFIIAFLVLLHPVLIFLPEDFTSTPLRLEYWPEAAGIVLLMLICLQVGLTHWRKKLKISFNRWWSYHRYAGGLIILLLILHILFVSETFEEGVPRYVLLGAAAVFILSFLVAKISAWRAAGRRYVINRIRRENNRVVTLELEAGSQGNFQYLPGQFAFISVISDRISRETHPFTISSSPTQPGKLSFTIKDCGDWTSAIKNIRKGETASLNGPFGLFSHLICPDHQPLILIAGGIGITPMLSMLRYMRDIGDDRHLILLWSNRTSKDLVCLAELERIGQELTGLTMVHTFTGEKSEGAASGRLDRQNLEALLTEADRTAAVFICGPPRMMEQVAFDMRALGFNRRTIHTERFSL
jgi:predicted ferric reductase